MKLSRIKKLSYKIVIVYSLIVVLVYFARPEFGTLFYIGLGLIGLGQVIRIWATGHLSKNKVLTVTGPYAYVKNPLYVGTFLIMIGFCFVATGEYPVNWILLGLGVLIFAAYYVPYKRKREGDRLRKIFGEEWDAYDKAVPDYFPRLTPYGKGEQRWSFGAVVGNSELWTLVAILFGLSAIVYRDELMKVIHGYLG